MKNECAVKQFGLETGHVLFELDIAQLITELVWNLANVYYNQGHYKRCIEIYKKSIKLDESYVIAINNIGNALDHMGDYSESIPYHERAINLDPTFHYAWMAKGRALTRLNRPEEGIEFIENDMAWHHKSRVSDEELDSLYAALEGN